MNNKEIQYYHNKQEYWLGIKTEYTVACKVPTNEDLEKMIKLRFEFGVMAEIQLLFGITRVHPKDMYCYKTGREKARKNMKIESFKLNGINIKQDVINFTFTGKCGTLLIQTKEGRKTPYLLMVNA